METTAPASWDDLPPEIVANILKIRRDTMRAEAREREMQRVLADFYARVWRARPRVFRRRLPPVTRLQ